VWLLWHHPTNDGFLIDFLNGCLQMDWTMPGMRAASMGLHMQCTLPVEHGGRGVKRVLGWPDVRLAGMIL
jgi:hypothetical protein